MSEHSKIYSTIIKTSERHHNAVTITAQRIKNDINGNPRYRVQVWLMRGTNGNLWSPIVKGYRKNTNDEYTINGSSAFNIDEAITRFIKAFEKSVYAEEKLSTREQSYREGMRDEHY